MNSTVGTGNPIIPTDDLGLSSSTQTAVTSIFYWVIRLGNYIENKSSNCGEAERQTIVVCHIVDSSILHTFFSDSHTAH